ncbi:MAG: DUF5916 domain-containing protein [Pseudomonadota bacterium]
MAEVDITIDGSLSEPIWQSLEWHDDLVVIEPDTLAEPPFETRIKFFYTNRGLYIGVWNEQPSDTQIARLSSRDDFIPRDDVSFTLDPSGQGLYGYWFGVNLGGTLYDGTVLPERQFSNQWDGPWQGASASQDGSWSAEYFIPWSMMTMPDTPGGTREMGYYISRKVAYLNERWGYPALPRTRPMFLSQLQKIRFEGIAPKQQLAFYPYASASYDNLADSGSDTYKAGFDIFWRPSTNLQLTATVNPDFGNVESDDVDVNLTSFETFFPERRAFFLEGNEIFVATPRARSSGDPITLVNTRRIGSPPRPHGLTDFDITSLEKNRPSELIGAAKLTGQSGRLRYGVLGAFEENTLLRGTRAGAPSTFEQTGRDYGIGRVLYEDTSAGGRRAFGWMGTAVMHPEEDAFAQGIDAHYLSTDGKWNLDGQLLHSSVGAGSGVGGFVDIDYSPSRGKTHSLSLDYFDDSIDINDFGYLRRNDSVGIRYGFDLSQSDLDWVRTRNTRIRLVQDFNTGGRSIRSGVFFSQDYQLNNNDYLFYELNFFPERWDDKNSGGNGAYKIHQRFQTGAKYGTDSSRKIRLEGGYFLRQGDLGGMVHVQSAEVTWRPNDRFSFRLEARHETQDNWLIYWTGRSLSTFGSTNWRPKIETDFFLTARQQIRVTAEWAGIKAFEHDRWQIPGNDGELLRVTAATDTPRDFSISRLTFQARYRWEIAPLSDLFVVYTRGSNLDSRTEDSFGSLLRASWSERLVDTLVVKLRYRLGS